MTKLNIALTIAGTDPTGGAGIMADLKSFQARGVYGMAVVTSVVAQNTLGVQKIHNIPLDILDAQLNSVFSDITPNAIKTGMLANVEIMEVVKKYLSKDIAYVVDPVMVATSGDKLIDSNARNHLKNEILPLATIITPNVPEAEEIVGFKIVTEDDINKAGKFILTEVGCKSVIIKGGHLEGKAKDYLFTRNDLPHIWESERINTKHTHGTGCTFSAVITAELAKGNDLITSVDIAKKFITAAIKNSPEIGHGSGPVNHIAYKE